MFRKTLLRPNTLKTVLQASTPRLRPALTAISPAQTRKMTEIKKISTPLAAQPVAAYSQAIQAGPHIYVSGQIPADAQGNLVEGSIAEKTTVCIEGLKNVLEAAGSSLSKVLKVTIFLTTMDNFAEMNSVYEKYFGETRPARSCVAVHQLPKGVPVELECVALSASGPSQGLRSVL
ncbi:unnamed protein product [Zymoseptoria tritici ST99CH_3D7]|uniref:YjgF-like protein n=3 Tax=Zymoseptoria tritici TaxID=1047171 RepID=A0A1X7RC91_ZYMT9|nr:unnamed protein product [Zymoseptoria tritici ST99CH_3D7]